MKTELKLHGKLSARLKTTFPPASVNLLCWLVLFSAWLCCDVQGNTGDMNETATVSCLTQLSNMCASSALSCSGRCGEIATEQDDSSFCSCDSFCHLYNDCCFDFEELCIDSLSTKGGNTVYQYAKNRGTCLFNGFSIISHCGGLFKDQKQPLDVARVTTEIVNGAPFYVTESCKASENVTERLSWTTKIVSTEGELDLTNLIKLVMGSKVKGLHVMHVPEKSSPPPRVCSHAIIIESLDGEEYTTFNAPKLYQQVLFNQQAPTTPGTFITSVESLITMKTDVVIENSGFDSSTGAFPFPTDSEGESPRDETYNFMSECKLKMDRNTARSLIDDPDTITYNVVFDETKNILSEEGEKIVEGFMISPREPMLKTHSWFLKRCMKLSDASKTSNTFVESGAGWECKIIACSEGYFFVKNKCRLPGLITLNVTRKFQNDGKSYSSLIMRMTNIITTIPRLRVVSLGNRVLSEGMVVLYMDHFTVTSITLIDTERLLPMTVAMADEVQNAMIEIGDSIQRVTLCFVFENTARSGGVYQRCDTITAFSVTSDVEDYSIDLSSVQASFSPSFVSTRNDKDQTEMTSARNHACMKTFSVYLSFYFSQLLLLALFQRMAVFVKYQ